jgi:hypothetical protein
MESSGQKRWMGLFGTGVAVAGGAYLFYQAWCVCVCVCVLVRVCERVLCLRVWARFYFLMSVFLCVSTWCVREKWERYPTYIKTLTYTCMQERGRKQKSICWWWTQDPWGSALFSCISYTNIMLTSQHISPVSLYITTHTQKHTHTHTL